MSIQGNVIKFMRDYYQENISKDTALMAVYADEHLGVWEMLDRFSKKPAFHKGKLILKDWKHITGAPITTISYLQKRSTGPSNNQYRSVIGSTTGVYQFTVADRTGEEFVFLYGLYEFGVRRESLAVALIPSGKRTEWARLEQRAGELCSPRLKPSKSKAYIIGSYVESTLKPKYKLDDVILDGKIKEQICSSIDGFFNGGLDIYKQFKVPPFRKILLWGPPGTGKSMFAEAVAADQLSKNRLVVYVSAADKGGADFGKIQAALQICKDAKHSVLLIVEEIEGYLSYEENAARVRNVLDGAETPNNQNGAVLLMTSNRPQIMDNALLRLGRIDEKYKIDNIKDPCQAYRLLNRYMDDLYDPGLARAIAASLIGLPPVFVRELAFATRMRMAETGGTISLKEMMLEIITTLKRQTSDQATFQKEVERMNSREQHFGFTQPEEDY